MDVSQARGHRREGGWGFTTIALYMAGRLNTEMFGAGLLDLMFGAAFFVAYLKVSDTGPRTSRG